jgi:hypothetical protein
MLPVLFVGHATQPFSFQNSRCPVLRNLREGRGTTTVV